MDRTYKIYCVGRDDEVISAESVPARTDEAAMAAARALKYPGMREVWQGDRLVGTILIELAGEPAGSLCL